MFCLYSYLMSCFFQQIHADSPTAELRKFYRLQNWPIIVFCFYFSIEVTPNPSWRCLRASNLFHSLFTLLYQWFDAIHWLLYFVTGAVRRHEIPPKGYPFDTLRAFWSKPFQFIVINYHILITLTRDIQCEKFLLG